MQEKATAREIILAVIENMHAGVEPLLNRSLVPSLYHVYLYRDDFQRLEGIFPALIEESRQALDEELARLNREGNLSRFLKKLSGESRAVRFERADRDWFISIHPNTDDDSKPGEIVVDSYFAVPGPPEYGAGSKTRRILTRRASGESRTIRKEWGEAPVRAAEAPVRSRPLARIRYQDDGGPQEYLMTTEQVAIGRGGIGYWVDLKLEAPSDVSREHLRIRREPGSGQFFIKDLSTFGTTMEGQPIPASIETLGGEPQDRNLWVPLPSKARIGLAGVLFLEFEVL